MLSDHAEPGNVGVTRPILLYLAGPQDDVSKAEARGWRESLIEIAPVGVVFFSPAHAYLGTSEANFPAVDRCNRFAINVCDAMIANISGPGRAFGTVREIEFASMMNKPVAVVGEVVSLMGHDLLLCSTLEEALDAVLGRLADERQPPTWIRQMLFPEGEAHG